MSVTPSASRAKSGCYVSVQKRGSGCSPFARVVPETELELRKRCCERSLTF